MTNGYDMMKRAQQEWLILCWNNQPMHSKFTAAHFLSVWQGTPRGLQKDEVRRWIEDRAHGIVFW